MKYPCSKPYTVDHVAGKLSSVGQSDARTTRNAAPSTTRSPASSVGWSQSVRRFWMRVAPGESVSFETY